MSKTYRQKVLAVVATAGLVATPLAGSALAQDDNGHSDGDHGHHGTDSEADATSYVDQRARTNVEIVQGASSNSGDNLQTVDGVQGNITGQNAVSDAYGGHGDAYVDTREADGDVVATGGDGGMSGAANESGSSNSSSGGNSASTGSASAGNAISGSVSQTQNNSSTNTATADAVDEVSDDDHDAVDASAEADSFVSQTARADVYVDQTATANSGANIQSVATAQGNITEQNAVSAADGGDAVADAIGRDVAGAVVATGGAGGTSAAANASESSNASSGGNSLTTGAASSSNTASVIVTQSSTNTGEDTSSTTSFGSG